MYGISKSINIANKMKANGSGGELGILGEAGVCVIYGLSSERELRSLIDSGEMPGNNKESECGSLGWTIDSIKEHLMSAISDTV